MTPALRDELAGLRKTIAFALARVDEILAIPEDAAQGKTPAAIVKVLEGAKRPMSPREVFDALTCAGREVSEAAVYQACHRLARAGKVRHVKAGRYETKDGEQR